MTAEQVLKRMTLKEKLRQLTQLSDGFLNPKTENALTGPKSDLGVTDEDIAGCGSVIGSFGEDETHRVKNGQLKHEIPMTYMLDVIHGCETIYPVPLGMGATFDPELMKECAAMAAREAKAIGIDVTFSPMVDMVRDARWGRVMESTGEDVYLNCLFAKAQVEGYQGEGVAACVKHFAAYGAPEAGKDYNAVDMSELTLREKYLPAYKAAVDAGAKMVMTSFNSLNGVPSAANKRLVKGILRDEWGFDGVVISDFNAFREMISHGIAENEKECAYKAMSATNDIEMMSATYLHSVEELIAEGRLTEKQVDEAVLRVLKLKEELGLFEKDYATQAKPLEQALAEKKATVLTAENRALARKAAEKACVLLKNDGVLPFDKGVKKVAVIGPFAAAGEIIGNWRACGDKNKTTTVFDGVKNVLPDAEVRYAKGVSWDLTAEANGEEIAAAAALAAESDIVLLTLGEHPDDSGEGTSRQNLELPAAQYRLAEKVLAANKNTAVALFAGRPLAIVPLSKIAPAILLAWQPGTEGGSAIANLLFGDVMPEGKLPMSFPKTTGQCPLHYDYFNSGRPHWDDTVRQNFCCSYIDGSNLPLYPFGYGLTYTTFAYSDAKLSKEQMKRGETIALSVKLKNTGTRAATETVQLYLHDKFASAVRPLRELKAFKKVTLAAGEETEVTFEITEEMLKFYNADLEYAAENGEFEAFVGGDCNAEAHVTFRLV